MWDGSLQKNKCIMCVIIKWSDIENNKIANKVCEVMDFMSS